MSKPNILRTDISATYFAELCTKAGEADRTLTHLKYLSVREVKALPAETFPVSFINWEGRRVHLWVEETRAGNRRFYTRSERA